jgi:hypothetical protein
MTDELLSTESTEATADITESTADFNFREHLSDDYKEKFPEIKDINGLAKSYVSLVGKIGKSPLVRPTENSSDDERGAFLNEVYKELGVPDEPSGYEVKLSEDLPEGLADMDLIEHMKPAFKENGVPPEAVNNLINTMLKYQSTAFSEVMENMQNEAANSEAALKESWGNDYDANKNVVDAFMNNNFTPEAIEKFGADPDAAKSILNITKDLGEKYTDLGGRAETQKSLSEQALEIQMTPEYRDPRLAGHAEARAKAAELHKRAADLDRG